MNALVFMIPLSILFLAGAAVAFFWAVDHEQFGAPAAGRLSGPEPQRE